MSGKLLRAELQAALHTLATGDLRTSATALLGKLGYASHKTLELPTQPQAFAKEVENLLGGSKQLNPVHASLAEWQSAAFLFQLTNDELPALAAGQMSLLTDTGGVQAWLVESFVFLALDLKPGAWSRTRLAALTREVNRLFPMPAVLLFRHPREDGTPLLSISVIHRRANKRDASQDVIEGKVSVIKDIDLGTPHAAHLRILESMALTEVDAKYVPSSFDKLYEAWLKVLDVKALNDRFYKDLAEWYYWAILARTGVVFPKGQPLEKSDDPTTNNRPTVALIRLLTRLIFVWFLKEKHLVPAALFDEKALAALLNTPPHQHGAQGNYYKAILQNLFFATLNTETADEDEDGNKQRVWRATAGPKRMDKYLIHTAYRYKGDFKDPDAALALFRKVPFLNGGLFECLDKLVTPEDAKRDPTLAGLIVTEGKQTVLRVDGFSERDENPMHIPNELFFGDGADEVDLNDVFGTKNRKYKPRGLLKIFDSYKFTIEENTPVEEEVALDPELLGKVFENLLASYNPDTKTTARKKSGSFYTPREVVDYMVDEALVCYLERPISAAAHVEPAQSAAQFVANGLLDLEAGPGDLELHLDAVAANPMPGYPAVRGPDNVLGDRLRRLLSYRQTGHDFSAEETQIIIAAIERLRVLDPACGSGAFPMGMLQKLVAVLRKLDPDNALWKAQNRAPLAEQLASAKKLRDPTLRDEQTTAALATLEKFDADFADPDYADYARKLYLIEKCLYGVDIQPIAVQIAKLRFFISLVVEQKLSTDHQRLTPLPNLETKIVAANTLLPIPRSGVQKDLLANPEVAEKEAELRDANASHFAAKRFADKRKRKEKILRLRDELATLLKAELTLKPGDAERMTAWDPFDQNRHADFFDPEWMFGFQSGFDIVIGNPPYVRQESIKDDKPRFKPHYATFSGTADLFVYFYERSFQLLNPHGCLSFITSNKWFRAKYGTALREYMVTHTELRQIIDFGDEAVFDALAYPTIVIATKRDKAVPLSDVKNELAVLNWDSTNENYRVSDFPVVFAAERFAVPQNELKPGGWQLEQPKKRRLLERLRKTGTSLRQSAGARIYRGVTTGFNDAFVIDTNTRAQLIEQDPKSAELIKPYLRGKDISRWRAGSSDIWLIFTRRGIDIDAYPAVKAHLKTFQTQLKPKPEAWNDKEQGAWPGRKPGSYDWHEIQDNIAYWEDFAQPKIVSTKVSIAPTFCLDKTGSFLGNTSYFFNVGSNSLFLLGLLNSAVSAFFSKCVFVGKQGGFYEVQPEALESLPIPNANFDQRTTVEIVVQTILTGVAAPEYERLLNGLVYELFFPEELQVKNIRLFDACTAAGVHDGMDAQAKATEIFHPRHPIYGQLFELQTLEVVRLIEGQS
ncbi:Eco57I restriction-modification methylase domain-containing protein [Rhodoferax sp. BLA1]|uniref:Eco57I restriction-modification methylase domain-containing protein n=1 Tax=Rhodoferax sp. BLA1 TaxID=2576062 RepID=UPI0015D4502C|nr:Eco57I restriction-modification methylase domain-containing protein [Rhodoferax sp. BLA1]